MPTLPQEFFRSTDVVQIARELLGVYLVTNIGGEKTVGKIVETEAYRAPDDRACHAWNNRRTARTEVMFGEGGHAYVYLCYGVHHLFNVVTAPRDTAHAVLIRAVEPVENLGVMLQRRGMTALAKNLTAGPGLLSQALGITTGWSGTNLMLPDSPIRLETGEKISDSSIASGKRIGVEPSGEPFKDWPWRFWVKDSKWVSR